MAYADIEESLKILISSFENKVKILDFLTGKTMSKMTVYYFITASKMVEESSILILAENRYIRAYNIFEIDPEKTPENNEIFELKSTNTVQGLHIMPSSGLVYYRE